MKRACDGPQRWHDGSWGYWCVCCGRFLAEDDDGVICHDKLPHPETMTFDDEERPQ